MFFVLSKLLDEVAAPLTWVIALAAVALWTGGLRGRRRVTVTAGGAAVALLYAFSVEPVANHLIRSLEDSARRSGPSLVGPYDAAIVLGGMASERSGTIDYNEDVDRLLAAFDVLRTGTARHAVLSGGRSSPDDREAESAILARQLVTWGIAADRIVAEDRSRNTHENALETARILRATGWTRVLLITSAFHMKRAAGCFRREGVTFDTLAVDFRAYDPARGSGSWLPRADSLAASTMALREVLGRWVYRARGYSVAWP